MAEGGKLLQEVEKTDEQRISDMADEIVDLINYGNWRQLGRKLGLREYQLQDIELKYVNHSPNFFEVCYQILSHWEQKSPKEFKKERLSEIVEEITTREGNTTILIPACHEQKELFEPKETQRKLECAQLEAYKGIEMEIAPWMTDTYLPLEKLYVELQMFYTDKFGNEDNGVFIYINEIFDPTEGNTQPRRILVEGDAGFGKTTLLNKLVDDWTKKKDYIYERFRNVFLFYLRDCNDDQSFEDFIRMECISLSVDEVEGLKCVKTYEKDTLFLLDGFDELSKDSKSKFENILLREEFKHSTVVVTSRRNELQRQDRKKIGPGLSVKHRIRKDHFYIWDKRILISGISEENQVKFLKKYLQIENLNKLHGQPFHIADKELFRCPLFLILLATVKDEENVQMIETQTDFYKFLLNVVTRRSLVRIHELDEFENVELFDSKHENYHDECTKQMDLFGSLAFQHLIKNKLTFTHKEIEDCCGKNAIFTRLGFINRRMSYKNWNRKDYYEPFHKSFLEFFAAYTLYRLAAKSDKSHQEEFKKKISDLVLENIIPNGKSLIYPFLAGLLNTGSSLLFDALSPLGYVWDIFIESFLNILFETKSPETLISSLIPYISPNLYVKSVVSSSKHKKTAWVILQELYSSSFKFQTVCTDYPFPFQIRTKDYELRLSKTLLDHSSVLMRRNNLSTSECENLLYTFEYCETGFLNVWQDAINIFFKTKFKQLKIDIFNGIDFILLLHKELTKGFWKNLDIDELTIRDDEILFLYPTEAYYCLSDLVQNNRIKNIAFKPSFDSFNNSETRTIKMDTFDFLDWKCLNQIYIDTPLENARSVLPFSRLCKNFKKWKFIFFDDLFDYSLTDSNLYCCVEEIQLYAFLDEKSCGFVMKNCIDITTLRCPGRLLDICLSTQNLSNLQNLRLNSLIDRNFDWCKLFGFPRLRSLLIEGFFDVNFCSAMSLTSFVCKSNLEILDLMLKTETLLIILQNFCSIGIEKKDMNKAENPYNDSEKYIEKNRCSNLKSLVIYLTFIRKLQIINLNKIFDVIKLLLKRNFVKEIIFNYDYNDIDFMLPLLVSATTEGFLLSRDKSDVIAQNIKNIIISCPDTKPN